MPTAAVSHRLSSEKSKGNRQRHAQFVGARSGRDDTQAGAEPLAAQALVAWTDAFVKGEKQPHSAHDEMALPFLIRKALVEQGCEIDGVIHFSGDEE